jgi:ectoine hydroxylase-related dioxygenase (phytanoyl-CoA dioxygenase family)
MYLKTPYKIKYDTKRFPFREIIQEILEQEDLENLHKVEEYKVLSREQDQKTVWHQKYYENFREKFNALYLELVKEIKEQFGYEEIVYQKIPTFRVQLVNNLGVGEWHKDRTYNHGVTEVNFWMPFTDTYGNNTIWIESKEDLGDYSPYDVKYGEILIFDGANIQHGNKINDTEDTRVSVDFRLVDPQKFIPTKAGSINMNASFDIGGYFEKL